MVNLAIHFFYSLLAGILLAVTTAPIVILLAHYTKGVSRGA